MKNENLNNSRSRRANKLGQPPGSLFYTGKPRHEKPTLEIIRYNTDEFHVLKSGDIGEILGAFDKEYVNWININGIHDESILRKTGDYFGIHSLVLEDVMNTGHLPKIEEYDSYIFATLKMLTWPENSESIISEHFSFVIGDSFIISLQEYEGDLFTTIRERLSKSMGKGRQRGADYLFYLLADKIIDHYYTVIEKIENRLENIEDELFRNPSEKLAGRIMEQRKTLLQFIKYIYPLRDDLRNLIREENRLITKTTLDYLFDLKDHLMEISQSIEASKEITVNLLELHNSFMANKMNNVMMTLTTIATIFIPLTFIAGIYGMNFHDMPELGWRWGYPAALFFMLLTGLGMYMYIKKRKWF
ncbi:MAG: magnesium/cobalt transporter CorA [Bacteroidales bacterium]|nr:magnesium/cobalt transporter CorA [Bacteroidales bacterium]